MRPRILLGAGGAVIFSGVFRVVVMVWTETLFRLLLRGMERAAGPELISVVVWGLERAVPV